MLKQLIGIVAMVMLVTSLAVRGDDALPSKLSDLLARGYTVSNAPAIADLERESLKEMKGYAPRVPQIPFGFNNARWEAFKAKMKPGDVIFRVRSSQEDGWWEGLILVRGDIIIDELVESIT